MRLGHPRNHVPYPSWQPSKYTCRAYLFRRLLLSKMPCMSLVQRAGCCMHLLSWVQCPCRQSLCAQWSGGHWSQCDLGAAWSFEGCLLNCTCLKHGWHRIHCASGGVARNQCTADLSTCFAWAWCWVCWGSLETGALSEVGVACLLAAHYFGLWWSAWLWPWSDPGLVKRPKEAWPRPPTRAPGWKRLMGQCLFQFFFQAAP